MFHVFTSLLTSRSNAVTPSGKCPEDVACCYMTFVGQPAGSHFGRISHACKSESVVNAPMESSALELTGGLHLTGVAHIAHIGGTEMLTGGPIPGGKPGLHRITIQRNIPMLGHPESRVTVSFHCSGVAAVA